MDKIDNISKIAIGTVQFGLNYGVANKSGQIYFDEAKSIIDYAIKAGINTFDTAISYGESEQRLGEIGLSGFNVISKLPAINDKTTDVVKFLHDSIEGSLARLRVASLQGFLLHRSSDLLNSNGMILYTELLNLKKQGVIQKIGVSIYDPSELDVLWPNFSFDLVQAPFNVIDRRLVTSGWLKRLRQSGVEVHTRSCFLQGLLLLRRSDRPLFFNRWLPIWERWERWLNEMRITPLKACIDFALSQSEVSRIVVGVDSIKHLQEILACVSDSCVTPPNSLTCGDEDLINPSRWSLK